MDRTGPRPLILIRGFGGPDVSGEQRSAYQGYNDGTVYPGRRGENYIYEGFLLRAMKSDRYRYNDATNVVGYYAEAVDAPEDLAGFDVDDVSGTVVIGRSLGMSCSACSSRTGSSTKNGSNGSITLPARSASLKSNR